MKTNIKAVAVLAAVVALLAAGGVAKAEPFVNPPELNHPDWVTPFPYQRNILVGFDTDPHFWPDHVSSPTPDERKALTPSVVHHEGTDDDRLYPSDWLGGDVRAAERGYHAVAGHRHGNRYEPPGHPGAGRGRGLDVYAGLAHRQLGSAVAGEALLRRSRVLHDRQPRAGRVDQQHRPDRSACASTTRRCRTAGCGGTAGPRSCPIPSGRRWSTPSPSRTPECCYSTTCTSPPSVCPSPPPSPCWAWGLSDCSPSRGVGAGDKPSTTSLPAPSVRPVGLFCWSVSSSRRTRADTPKSRRLCGLTPPIFDDRCSFVSDQLKPL